MKLIKGLLIVILAFAVISCGRTERKDDWYRGQGVYMNVWTISIRDVELEDVSKITIELEENDFVVANKDGGNSKLIVYIEKENYYKGYIVKLERFIGEDMAGKIVINDSGIFGDDFSYDVEFEGKITGVEVILALEENLTDSEFEDWLENNYIEIKY